MPDKPAAPAAPHVDHRIMGHIRRSLADVSPRVVEDVTMRSEQPSFRDRASGDIFRFVVAEAHATTRAADRPKDRKPTVEDHVFDVLCESLKATDPALMRDVARTDTGVAFVESSSGKTFGVTLEKVGERYGNPEAAPAPAPTRVTHATPHEPPAPMAPQSAPGSSPV